MQNKVPSGFFCFQKILTIASAKDLSATSYDMFISIMAEEEYMWVVISLMRICVRNRHLVSEYIQLSQNMSENVGYASTPCLTNIDILLLLLISTFQALLM